VCQKKGGRVFSWRDTIQKRPPGMDISLRQNGAFHLDTRGGEARTVATALRTLPEHPVRPHLTLRHTTPGLTWAGSCLILLLTMAVSTWVAPAVQAWVRPGQGVEHSACITGGVCWTPGPPSRGEEGSHGLATESCASQDARSRQNRAILRRDTGRHAHRESGHEWLAPGSAWTRAECDDLH